MPGGAKGPGVCIYLLYLNVFQYAVKINLNEVPKSVCVYRNFIFDWDEDEARTLC